jgi:F0F1-type ATP synthase gamma subunit
MNAITFLIKDHDKVRMTFKEIDKDDHHFETKKKMFDKLCSELLRHENMEHTIWYPHFKNHPTISAEVRHLIKEENHAENMIKRFNSIKEEKEWNAMFIKFRKEVEHHAREEETKLFPIIQRNFSEDALNQIGLEMFHFKQEHNNLQISA